MELVEETLLLAPWGIVTLTALKCIGVSPTAGNLAEATNVRVVAGAAGGVCPAAGTVSAAQTRRLPIVVDRMWLSLNELVLGNLSEDWQRRLHYAASVSTSATGACARGAMASLRIAPVTSRAICRASGMIPKAAPMVAVVSISVIN